MRWEDPPYQPAAHLCESCKRERATQVLARPERHLTSVRITRQRIAPSVTLCHFCWLTILWGLKPMPSEV